MVSEHAGPGLEGALDELYRVDPGDFVATRTRLARDLRAAGDVASARQLEAARRPTSSARVLNVLARRRPELIHALLQASDELRAAQTLAISGAPGSQRDATRAQRRSLSDVVDAADELPGGMSGAVRAEILSTLHAAAADPDLGAVLRAGRLERAEVTGFGFPGVAGVAGPDGPPADELAARRSRRALATEADEEDARRQARRAETATREEQRARERARQREAARALALQGLADAEAASLAAMSDAEQAVAALADAEGRVEQLEGELDAARLEVRAAKHRVGATARAARRRAADADRRKSELEDP